MLRVVAEEDDEDHNRPSVIRKRADRQTNNMFSSMITVPEDNSTTSAENAIAAAMAANLATDDTISNATPTKRGSMLDDSFRSTNSLVNKMQSALNEEWSWMSKRQHSPPPQDGPPVKTLLLSDNDQQHRQSGNNPTKSRTKKADLIFGLVLLIVGFVIGGIFIHRDKLMYEMTALLSGTHTQQHHQGGDPRQLPIIQHTLTYEERAQLYREKRQAGMLRPIGGEGKLGIDEQERLRYQQYFGYDQLREGHHQGESKF